MINLSAEPTLIKALKSIRKTAMEHPAFDGEAFEKRDIDSLVSQGGDVCDWTMVAIEADDALKQTGKIARAQ